MMKRVILGTALSFSLLANAGWATGFYVGGGLGPDQVTFTDNASIFQIQNNRYNFNATNREQLSGAGIFGTLFAGYGTQFNNFNQFPLLHSYLGLEINGDLSSLEHKNSNDEYVHNQFIHTKFKMQYSYGISVLPGIVYDNNTLFYARLGYANGHFKISTTDISLANTSKNLSGFKWGLGMQRFVSSSVAIRMEYDQTAYHNASISALDTGSNTTKITRITPRRNQVQFGLLYQFS